MVVIQGRYLTKIQAQFGNVGTDAIARAPATPLGVTTRPQGPAAIPPATPPRTLQTATSTAHTATATATATMTTTQTAAASTTDAAMADTAMQQPVTTSQAARHPATSLMPDGNAPAATNAEMTTLANAIHLMMASVARLEARVGDMELVRPTATSPQEATAAGQPGTTGTAPAAARRQRARRRRLLGQPRRRWRRRRRQQPTRA
jgi:hypothetical protein